MTLHSLFHKIATASTEEKLRLSLMDHLSQCFGVQRWGIYLVDAENNLISSDVCGVSDRFIETYQQVGQAVDPVLKYVKKYHAPAHEELVLSPGTWKQSQLYQRCCIQGGHEHIMTGPIVGNGNLIGTINFARVGHTPPFNTQDLSNLSAVSLHVSACLANLRARSRNYEEDLSSVLVRENLLTQREMQIMNLVSKGLTNVEIGKELWISHNTVKQALKKIFRKLEVSSRIEAISKIHQLP
ncbi:MAG: LuxR C-terminal-related transcriptional regulator [Cyanobacteria bacterium J06642_3]